MSFSVRRYLNTLRWDIMIQFRYGFYYASGVVMLTYIAALWFIPSEAMLIYLPPFILSNLNIGTFFFVGAMILFEKGESTMDALLITPQTFTEYLSSKVSTLVILGLIENLIIILILMRDVSINYFWIVIGIISMAIIYTLIGVGFAVGYHGISDFLFPSMLLVFILEFPLFAYLGLSGGKWDYLYLLFPLQPMISLTKLAVQSVPTWELIYGIIGSIFWIYVAFRYATNRYNRFIVRKEVVYR